MENRPLIIFSTVTGNGYKLACAAEKGVKGDYLGPYNIRWVKDELLEKAEMLILTYWCNRGTADDDTIDLLRRVEGKKIVIIGSLGADSASEHAEKVRASVAAIVKEKNILVADYLCRGSIDVKRTFEKTKIPEGEKGHLSMERYENQLKSLGHPNEEELDGARRVVEKVFEQIGETA